MELFLRIAPELYLKRLVVGGFERCSRSTATSATKGSRRATTPSSRCWSSTRRIRTTGTSWTSPRTAARRRAQRARRRRSLPGHGDRPRQALRPAHDGRGVRKYHPQHTEARSRRCPGCARELEAPGVEVHPAPTAWAKLQLKLLRRDHGGKLIQPTFIIDYPAEVSPLARANDADPEHHRSLRTVHHRPRDRQRLLGAERPRRPGRTLRGAGEGEGCRRRGSDVLRRRLHARARVRPAADGGEGIGIDRLVMLLTDSPSIRDVILLPAPVTCDRVNRHRRADGCAAQVQQHRARQRIDRCASRAVSARSCGQDRNAGDGAESARAEAGGAARTATGATESCRAHTTSAPTSSTAAAATARRCARTCAGRNDSPRRARGAGAAGCTTATGVSTLP
jgi:hypothetical protein